jgi:hypothetical protein
VSQLTLVTAQFPLTLQAVGGITAFQDDAGLGASNQMGGIGGTDATGFKAPRAGRTQPGAGWDV